MNNYVFGALLVRWAVLFGSLWAFFKLWLFLSTL